MRKLIFTLLLSITILGFAKAATVFDPATYVIPDSLKSTQQIVDTLGQKFLKIRLNGWNTYINVPNFIVLPSATQLKATYLYKSDTSGVANSITDMLIQPFSISNKNKIGLYPSSPADTFAPVTASAKAAIGDTLVSFQLAGMSTSTWSGVVGSILYISKIEIVEPFDIQTFKGDIPTGCSIDTINNVPYLKTRLDGWNTNVNIAPIIITPTALKLQIAYKYDADTAATKNDHTVAMIQLFNSRSLKDVNSFTDGAPASDTFKTLSITAKADTVSYVQLAGMSNVVWDGVKGSIIYVGKLNIVDRGYQLLAGGNMEDSTAWNFYWGTNGVDKGTHQFNYTANTPKDGKGGCYRVTGAGQAASFIWQAVTVRPGHIYNISGAFKNASVDSITNTWAEVFLTRVKPTGGDVATGIGYAQNTWNGPRTLNFDGTIQDSFKLANTPTKDIIIPDSVTQTVWYFVVKAGIYNNAGDQHPAFDILYDELSCLDKGYAPSDFQIAHKIFGTTPKDYKGDVNMTWDKDSVYMTYTVADDSIVNTGTAYQVDNIEVYFDMNNSKNIHWPRNGGWLANVDAAYDSTDYQLRLVPGVPFATNNAARPSSASIDTGYNQIYTRTKIGYDFQLNIAWNDLKKGFSPSVGKKIGFDVNLSDNNAVASDANRNQFTMNSPNPNLFNDPASWATLQLGDSGRFIQIFDKKAPTVPTALKDTIIGGKAKITWTASTDNIVVENYKIYVDGVLDTTILAAKTGNNYTTKKVLALGDHTIDVTAVDLYGNTSAKATVSLTVTVGIKETNLEIVKTYPNPVSDILKFSNSLSNKAVANVYSITGQLVLTSSIADGTLNVSSLNSGMYLIRLSDSGSNYVGKFIKK